MTPARRPGQMIPIKPQRHPGGKGKLPPVKPGDNRTGIRRENPGTITGRPKGDKALDASLHRCWQTIDEWTE